MIQIRSGYEEVEEASWSQHFPSFLWVLRDFALRLQDERGNAITSQEYLEGCLRSQPGHSDTAISKNHTRQLIRAFFADRDCEVLVRPAEDEKVAQYLFRISHRLCCSSCLCL